MATSRQLDCTELFSVCVNGLYVGKYFVNFKVVDKSYILTYIDKLYLNTVKTSVTKLSFKK